MPTCYILLGSNLFDKSANLSTARELIDGLLGQITGISSVYQSEPWGFNGVEDFLNQVIELQTSLQPAELLGQLKNLEKLMGRGHTERNNGYSPRIIDMDILLYDDRVVQTHELTIPHPLLHLRRFTLLPLSEIAGDLIHPVLKKSIRQLLMECEDPLMVNVI